MKYEVVEGEAEEQHEWFLVSHPRQTDMGGLHWVLSIWNWSLIPYNLLYCASRRGTLFLKTKRMQNNFEGGVVFYNVWMVGKGGGVIYCNFIWEILWVFIVYLALD